MDCRRVSRTRWPAAPSCALPTGNGFRRSSTRRRWCRGSAGTFVSSAPRRDRDGLAAGGVDADFVVADVDHVDDTAAEPLEVDLTERAARGLLCACDCLGERDLRLRQQIFTVVKCARLGKVVVVPDGAWTAP